MKPLVLVNGKPLLQHALDHAHVDWGVNEITVVASPENVKALVQVTPAHYLPNTRWVVQPRPEGLLSALACALPTLGERVLILCADNIFDKGDDFPDRQHLSANEWIVATRDVELPDTQRFTRVSGLGSQSSPASVTLVIDKGKPSSVRSYAWIGPLLVPRWAIASALDNPSPDANTDEAAEIMRRVLKTGEQLTILPMLCADMGVPEVLT